MIASLLCTNSRSVWAAITLLGIAMFARLAGSACAQSIDGGKGAAKVIAYLGEQRITDHEVDFQLGRNQFEGGQVEGGFESAPLTPAVLHSALHLIALQRQALQTMRVRKLAVSRDDTERWVTSNLKPPSEDEVDATKLLERLSQQSGVAESVLRDHFTFRISWQRYLQQQLTDANIAKHFENQRARFDGSRFQIALLSLAGPPGKSSVRDKAQALLIDVRDTVEKEPPDWEAIAGTFKEKWQLSEWKLQKELWVRGTGDLDPTLVTKLLAMKPGEVSDPVQTATGLHLVKLIASEAGTKTLSEVRDEVRAHMLIHLLEFLAKQSEPQLPLRMSE